MKIYISGKITGLPLSEIEAKFQQAEWLLEDLGLEAINPLKNGLDFYDDWKKHLVVDIENLLSCDAIYMLDNWVDSKGARIEKSIADETGMDVWFESRVIKNQKVVLKIQNAIHEVAGLRFSECITKNRRRDGFFARMIFVYHCNKQNMIPVDIAQYIHRHRTDVYHYLKKYDNEVKYSPYFRNIATNVDERLNPKSSAI